MYMKISLSSKITVNDSKPWNQKCENSDNTIFWFIWKFDMIESNDNLQFSKWAWW